MPSGTPPWRLRKREVALVFAFWTFLAALSIANRVLDPRGPGMHLVPPSAPVILILFESYLWAALTPLVFKLASRFAPSRGHLWRLPLLLVLGLGLAILAHLAVEVLRVEVLEVPRRGPSGRVPPIQISWFLNDYIVYLGVLAAGFARDYFRRYEARNQEAARLQAEAAVLQARLAEAQLSALRMQLNPHFLFNTLHAISALVERDPAGVRRMIARLSELLRSTLDESAQAERTAEQEMDFVARYLDIMKIRFQDRLEVVTELDPRARAALLPTLILQPLVENAVKHGVARVRKGGRIVVRVERAGDRLRLSVRDNGPGVDPGAEEGGGVGLSNTRQRLQQMYGAGQDLRLTRLAEGGTLAEVEVPFRPAHDVPLPEPRAEALPVGHGR
jgi:two-component system, LytTR family, sensor kinase